MGLVIEQAEGSAKRKTTLDQPAVIGQVLAQFAHARRHGFAGADGWIGRALRLQAVVSMARRNIGREVCFGRIRRNDQTGPRVIAEKRGRKHQACDKHERRAIIFDWHNDLSHPPVQPMQKWGSCREGTYRCLPS
ncbi:hypothetical protein [Dyella mobilis]|uniref:Transposase n=1 Tax=Dyella mobilis TaxID=1849582 RepID=A0ABS2KL85_9GAMM|nr:hypothetical protein [Dyella mobilis]MBM7131849.1 hypothetical protein [Dyella mobilis]GLQ96171.1 hypothetical protein GCM10007863_05890 [Dyella mobilis]